MKSQVFNNNNDTDRSELLNSGAFIAKVFLYMFLGLLISALVCVSLSALLVNAIGVGDESFLGLYLTLMIVSLLGLLVTSFIISIKRIRMKSILVPYLFYVVFMGVLMSSFVYYVENPYIIGISLAITSLIFLITCFSALIFKGRIGWLLGLLFGGILIMGVLSLVNLFLFPWAFHVQSAFDASLTIYWIIEAIFVLMIIISTFIDMYNLKKIASYGGDNSNLALYYSMNLYSDFIMLFIRILYFVMVIFGRGGSGNKE